MTRIFRVPAAALVAALLLWAPAGWAQAVLQAGPILNGGGHAPIYLPLSPQGLATVMDSGAAGGGPIGYGLSEKLLQARGNPGSPGTGPLGAHDCDWDTFATNPAGAHYLCFDPNIGGNAVIASSNPLNFVINGQTIPFPGNAVNPRNFLGAPISLYVTPTGNDNSGMNTCAAQSAPCLTLQQACNEAMFNYDLHGHSIFIQVADGTYHAGCSISGPLVGGVAAQVPVIEIVGDVATRDNVEINDTTTGGPAVFTASNGAVLTLDGMKMDSATGSAMYPEFGGEIAATNVDFGTTAAGHMHAETGGINTIFGNYSISGSAPAHIQNVLGGSTRFSEKPITVTFNGTQNFPHGYVSLAETSTVYMTPCLGGAGCPGSSGFGVTFIGPTPTGPRYIIQGNAVLETEDGNPNTFPPGTMVGSATGGGIYSPTGLVPSRFATSTVGATLYVNSTTGTDGSANVCTDVNLPCATLSYACSLVPTHDLGNDASLVIEVAAGSYSTGCYISGPSNGSQFSFPSNPGAQALPVIIEGPFSGSPAVVNDASGAEAAFLFGDGISVSVINLTIGSTTGDGILAQYGAHVFQQNNTFASCAGAQMDAKDGAVITMPGSYAISAGAAHHLLGERHGDFIFASGTVVTLVGTPAWGFGGVVLDDLSVADIPSSGVTFSGAATGTRYSITSNSVLDTGNAGGTPSTFLPGSVNGTTATGGQAL